MFLRQNTLQPINFGPFLSSADGFTPQTGLTIATANMQLSKDGGSFSSIASGSATHDIDGWYTANLTIDDVDTVGELKFKVMMTGTSTLPVWDRWWVLEEDIYDALYGASAAAFDTNQRVDVGAWLGTAVTTSATTNKPEVDVNSVSDDAIAADSLEADYDGTGYTKANSTIGTTTTNTDMRGTDSAALASVATEARLAELDAGNMPTDLANIETDTQDIQSRLPAALVGGNISADVAAIQNNAITAAAIATDAIDADALATDAVDEIVDGVWDEVLTGATHNIVNSAGRRLREAGAPLIREETAQGAGANNNQIQFDTGASAVDGAYDPAMVVLIEGTGVGQSRLILQYDGATRTATVDRDWKVNPDATTVFQILANPGREHVNEGLAQAGAASTITLNALASSVDDVYVGQAIFIRSGTGEDQRKFVVAYNGTTKVATVHSPWDITPDSTSAYVMLPQATGDYLTSQMAEPTGVSDIPATPTIPQALMLLYMRERNNTQVTTSERRIFNDAGVEVLDAPMSDNGTVFSQGKLTDA
jgi:hypothetical protein